ncbi:MAG: undecaprenyl-diphosphate phosphatase [Ilumatobacteraceae bacterium]
MPITHAIVLGIVQGLTEFLPISSSGHLLLVPWLFGWDDFESADVEKTFAVALHLGTLIAVVGYFWQDVKVYVTEGLKAVFTRGPASPDGRLAWLFVLATIPAAVVGALFEGTIDDRLGSPTIIAVSLIVFGVALGWADRLPGTRKLADFNTRDALTVGAAQALALNPGTSRSGITMTAARAVRFDRDAAVRISFLMSIPVILGALVFKGAGLVADGVPEDLVVPMIVGVITSALAGWLAIWGLLKFVQTRSFLPFVIYRVVLGVVILLLVATGAR